MTKYHHYVLTSRRQFKVNISHEGIRINLSLRLKLTY